jgi:hypothetical protein
MRRAKAIIRPSFDYRKEHEIDQTSFKAATEEKEKHHA